jgi:CDP-diacylglycerol--glycerol-3-phosphate 3-phosphatidyltransferase
LSIYALKPKFQALLRPLTGALARSGVTANQVTLAAAVASVAIGVFIAWRAPERWPFLLLPLWMFLRMALNAIDGMLAREFGQKSRLGAYLNELTDVVSDSALYLPFAFMPPFSALWTGIVIVLAVLSGNLPASWARGRRVASLRRSHGQERSRVCVRRARSLGRARLCAAGWLAWVMPLLALLIR